jgi:hypothetical protein
MFFLSNLFLCHFNRDLNIEYFHRMSFKLFVLIQKVHNNREKLQSMYLPNLVKIGSGESGYNVGAIFLKT